MEKHVDDFAKRMEQEEKSSQSRQSSPTKLTKGSEKPSSPIISEIPVIPASLSAEPAAETSGTEKSLERPVIVLKERVRKKRRKKKKKAN